MDLLKRARVPKKLQTLIAGESLFNDGVGVVVFVVLAGVAGAGGHGHEGAEITAGGVALLFLQEAVGGMLFGAVIGYVAYRMCRSVAGHVVEVLITLAMVIAGYLVAVRFGLSGPLAMVIAGLIISAGRHDAFHAETSEHVEIFWEPWTRCSTSCSSASSASMCS